MFRKFGKGWKERETSYAWIKLLYPGASGVAFTLERVKEPRLHSPHVNERDRQLFSVS